MPTLISALVLIVCLSGVIAFMFKGSHTLKRGRTPGWFASPVTGDGPAFVLDGLLAAAAASQLLAVSSAGIGDDVVGIALGVVTVVGARFGWARPVVGLGFSVVGVLASVPAIAEFTAARPECGSTLPRGGRLLLGAALVLAFLVSAIGAAVLMLPYSRRMLRRYSSIGLGLFGAVEFVLALTLLGAVAQGTMGYVMALVGAAVVGWATPIWPEVTIWTMGALITVYSLVGGAIFSYSGEPLVSACLGQRVNAAVLIGFLAAAVGGSILVRLVHGR